MEGCLSNSGDEGQTNVCVSWPAVVERACAIHPPQAAAGRLPRIQCYSAAGRFTFLAFSRTGPEEASSPHHLSEERHSSWSLSAPDSVLELG